MRKQALYVILLMVYVSVSSISCKKESYQKKEEEKQQNGMKETSTAREQAFLNGEDAPDPYNLNIDLTGTGNRRGDIKFRQDPDPAKIVTLDTRVKHLLPNHEYLLQRAVDQTIDGKCTGTSWLTLGLGLTPQSILTNGGGNGREELWRDLSAIPSGTVFDINFRVVDMASNAVVLTSGCYQYTVR